jgi:hypothetical protein
MPEPAPSRRVAIPSAEAVRRRLSEILAEANTLRRQLRASEHAEKQRRRYSRLKGATDER